MLGAGDHSHQIDKLAFWQGGKKLTASVFEACQARRARALITGCLRLGDLAAITAAGSIHIFVTDSDKLVARCGPVAFGLSARQEIYAPIALLFRRRSTQTAGRVPA